MLLCAERILNFNSLWITYIQIFQLISELLIDLVILLIKRTIVLFIEVEQTQKHKMEKLRKVLRGDETPDEESGIMNQVCSKPARKALANYSFCFSLMKLLRWVGPLE